MKFGDFRRCFGQSHHAALLGMDHSRWGRYGFHLPAEKGCDRRRLASLQKLPGLRIRGRWSALSARRHLARSALGTQTLPQLRGRFPIGAGHARLPVLRRLFPVHTQHAGPVVMSAAVSVAGEATGRAVLASRAVAIGLLSSRADIARRAGIPDGAGAGIRLGRLRASPSVVAGR